MELATDRLILRELAQRDAPRIFEIESLPEVARYLIHAKSEDEALAYVREMMMSADAEARFVFDFAVTERGNDRLIGRCGMKLDDDPRGAMLWYVLDPAVQGRGYATEATRRVIELAFEELDLHRVWADVDPRNVPSIRVAERLGMRKEAHHVENVCIDDEWCDTLIYAMLRREWKP